MADNQSLKHFLKDFILTEDKLKEVYTRFSSDIKNGLGKATKAQSDMKCRISYVQDLPTGKEEGTYLALDFSGSLFRILAVKLRGTNDAIIESEIYTVPTASMAGPGEELFDNFAACLGRFLEKYNLIKDKLALAFTFSFPCEQLDLNSARLLMWTKGYRFSGVESKDVGHMLSEAIAKSGLTNVRLVAVLSDGTGTLMSCAYRNQECRIGVVIDVGTNACYVERVGNVELLAEKWRNKQMVIINPQWGAFGDSGNLNFVRTNFDRMIDGKSANKGTQVFEKMIAGKYLGDLVRCILHDAVYNELIFEHTTNRTGVMKFLASNECMEMADVIQIEQDDQETMEYTQQFITTTLKLNGASLVDSRKVKFICETVLKRAANFAAVALSSLINKVGEPRVVIAIDGPLYRELPNYHNYLQETIAKYVRPGTIFELKLSEDGAGYGAAIVAAVVSH